MFVCITVRQVILQLFMTTNYSWLFVQKQSGKEENLPGFNIILYKFF